MIKTFGPVTRMGPNIWNALRMHSEFLEYTSNIQECTTNFHSDGIRAHSASSVTGVLDTMHGPDVWNALPDHVKHLPFLKSFKRKMKENIINHYNSTE